ncbi:MAG: hypothetical protein NTW60_02660 [Candidatus Wolfebacteria bacterium]|nr:hypothetical protein [Candidatus Wolfebacteria bacterium]
MLNNTGIKLLAIDETGKASLNHPSTTFILSGLILTEDYLSNLEKNLKNLKTKYFHDPDIVFHSRDMLRKKGPFSIFGDLKIELEFWPEYIKIISPSEVSIAIVVVDKNKAKKLGWNDIAILRRSYSKILEEFTKKYLINSGKGKIILESDPQQDKYLIEAHNRLQGMGIPSEGIVSADYRNKMTSISLVNKLNLDSHVQIADGLAIMGNVFYELKINKRDEVSLNQIEMLFKDLIDSKMATGIFEVIV